MKIESTEFTEQTYHDILGGYLERERDEIVSRLRRIGEETTALAPALASGGSGDGPSWNAVETLAHMSIAAAFFGWVIHEIAQGKQDLGGQMLELMNLRDPTIVEAVKRDPAELAKQLTDSLDRTIAFLEKTDPDELRNTTSFAGRTLSAADFARVSMVHHLEDHVGQMRAAANA